MRMQRRQFLRYAAGAIGTAVMCDSAAFAAEAGPTIDPAKGYALQTIGDGLYWVTDGAYSAMFLVTTAGVIACDAPPTLGANYLKAIAEVTGRPVTHLIYSHEHVDHIAGAHLFPKGITIIGHRRTAELLVSRNDPRRPPPTVTFEDSYTLDHGGQRVELAYKGANHSVDSIFIYAPRQKTLMAVDIVYPGWMPYKNLGVAVDIPGFVAAHLQILAYDFETLVAGHVSRPGRRADVTTQVALLKDLADTAERVYATLPFPIFLKQHPPGSDGKSVWDLHQDYEQAMVSLMADELRPRWRDRLAGTETYLRDNCWAMLETFVVQGKPDFDGL